MAQKRRALISKEQLSYADTSILIPLLLAPTDYREYVKAATGTSQPYYTAYNVMEFKNAVLCRCIALYSVVTMPQYKTTQDAFYYFGQRFKKERDNILLISILGSILLRRKVDLNNPAHKELALSEIWRVVKELHRAFRSTFIDCGEDRTRCLRARVELNFDAEDVQQEVERFVQAFSMTNYRPKCRVDHLVEDRCKEEALRFVEEAAVVKGREADGFRAQAKRVDKVLNGTASKTCQQCASMGDAVIALQAPRQMMLDHTDRSFDYLCPATKQQHRRLDSPGTFDRNRARSESDE